MNPHPEEASRRRRTGEEVGRLVSEFEVSGLRVEEFCRRHGLSTSTLRRRLNKPRGRESQAAAGGRLVGVKVNGALPERAPAAALEVLLRGGRKIRVAPGFDAVTFGRLVRALEDL